MTNESLFGFIIAVPALSGLLGRFAANQTRALGFALSGVFLAALFCLRAIYLVFNENQIFAYSDWIFLDHLSAWHLVVLILVFCQSTLFAIVYFGEEMREKKFSLAQARTFAGLWGPAFSAMALVLISNNLGIMWVGMEATTLLTSFLICIPLSRDSLEATWKYMLICSVGIGFAFLGTMLLRLAAKDLPLDLNQALLWTNLMANTRFLSVPLVKAAFIFALVGYGTKAGLAPMHSWLPDAHSKSPSPVSAIFSGFMLNAALYCIMRFIPITEEATLHSGWALRFLVGFGLFSVVLSAAFVLFQQDIKRFLAYCSVEHLGITVLGMGLGGFGTFAALFHVLNHSLAKSLAFFSAGRLGLAFGSHNIEKMKGSFKISPVWGTGIFAAILVLIGVVPFSLFISEFQVLKAAIDNHQIAVVIIFLTATGIIFAGSLRYALPLGIGEPASGIETVPVKKLDAFIVALPLLILLILGLWMPKTLQVTLSRAAAIVQTAKPIIPHFGPTGGK